MRIGVGLLGIILLSGLAVLLAQSTDYEALKRDAERYYAEGSYARARELYGKAKDMKLGGADSAWVRFRLADTLWRSESATNTPDASHTEAAEQDLQAMLSEYKDREHDELWAAIQESLGDFYWNRNDARNWGGAWPYYQSALDYWAGSDRIDTARAHYLSIVWRAAKPAWAEPYAYYGYYGNILPVDVLQNVLKIAQTEQDKVHAHYLLAMSWRQQGGNWNQSIRVTQEFEAAIKLGKTTDWYDDALFNYAQWLETNLTVLNDQGQPELQPDYARALAMYRRLTTEYKKGETRYYDQAQQEINAITKPSLSVSVSNVFLPESEIQYYLNWRNIKTINFSLYAVDLATDIGLVPADSSGSWLQRTSIEGKKPIRTWTKETQVKGDYWPGSEQAKLEGKLPVGAYVIVASSGEQVARDLILVTRSALVLKTARKQALVYVCNSQSGAPAANASVTLWQRLYNNGNYSWKVQSGKTNGDGLAVFAIDHSDGGNNELFVVSNASGSQAFSSGYSYGYNNPNEAWRIYAFTDRPAYRPGEQAQFKYIARRYDGGVYHIPADQMIEYQISDAQGSKVKDGKATLNAFGSAWDSLNLTAQMPLGEYQITFWDSGRHTTLGSATLFRLEEYKLPEFKVTVETPEENGQKETFRVGETVQVAISSEYYFGGPVTNATAEVFVYQNPYYRWWFPYREYSWYYDEMNQSRYRSYYGQGQIVKHETLKTDAEGKVTISFDTPQDAVQDFEYRVEARITDASRREITGESTIRVTRQRYFVNLDPKNYLYKPQDQVLVNIKALDPNDQPVQAEGKVQITRDSWYQVWIDPSGKEVRIGSGGTTVELPADHKDWHLTSQGYDHEDVQTTTVKTDAKGEAELRFTAQHDGYYRVAWTSFDPGSAPIKAETSVWACTNATTDLGYRSGGLEIIVDKDTFRAGQTAAVMIAAPTNDRYVLFSVEGDDLYSYQLIHLTGSVKLIQLPIEEKHVPNIFLHASMISDLQFFVDQKQVIVPPVKNFLNVEMKPDHAQYQPQEGGSFTVTAKDADGKPVVAEIAVSLTDASVFYIQKDYAGDPRQFYFGQKRTQLVQTQSSLQQKAYPRQDMDAAARDRREAGQAGGGRYDRSISGGLEKDEADQLQALGYVGNKEGVVAGAPMAKVVAERKSMAVPRSMPAAPPAEGNASQVQVVVRSDFRSTAFWQPDVITGKDGKATVQLKYPDSLTTWQATARAVSQANQYGIADASTKTSKPLIVRLESPRFFVVGDQVTLSAVANNNTDTPMNATITLNPGNEATLQGASIQPITKTIPAHGEARADWIVNVQKSGAANLTVTAKSSTYGDAMQKSFDVYEHGIDKFIAKSGKVRGNDVTVMLNLPKERKAGSTTMTVQVTPSLAVTMLDALPYLIHYPYGCTEQTMSRFLPSVITAKTLKDLGMHGYETRLYGGIEPEYAGKTHPEGKQNMDELNKMIRAGLDRLYDFQHSDGGWGWWKEGESDHWMSAYVTWGLTLASQAGTEVRSDVLSRARAYLDKELVKEEDNYDMQAWMLQALAASAQPPSQFQQKAFDNVYKNRDRLNAYTRALLALAAHGFGLTDQSMVLIRNLENGVKVDKSPDTSVLISGQNSDASVMGTAHWGADGIYWRWSDSGIESTSFALRALLAVDPQNALIEPVTNWLIKNRRGAQWTNTRDTAIAVLALNDYLRKSGEMAGDIQYEVSINGHTIATRKIAAADVFKAPSQFVVEPGDIRDENQIRICKISGNGPLYFAAQSEFFSLEEPITPAGHEIFVKRQYNRFAGKPTLLKGFVYDKKPMNDGDTITSGDRVETILTIETKNDYEYLLFEDLKPAGLEAVEIRSGANLYAQELRSDGKGYTGRTQWVYQELRDRKVALFIDKLPQGVWEIRYDLRAEIPGKFHALPVLGQAMYVPEIRCNGAETHITVTDKE